MTYRDQLEFKIRKLTRAIEALGDLPTGRLHLASSVAAGELSRMLKADRADLRRTVATGRRSCGECGHPMSHVGGSDPRVAFRCETDDCLGRDSVDIVRV